METEPTVSVIIPCFNAPETLQETIESVLRQTYSEVELVAIDDGSTDDTLERLRAFDDSRLTVLANEENRGIPATRNEGLQHAEGRYVCFLDQDDLWFSRKLEVQLEKITNNSDIGVVYSSFYTIDESGRPFALRVSEPATDSRQDAALGCYHSAVVFPNTTKLYRKECFDAVGALDESLYGSDDHDLDIRILSETDYVYEHIDTPLALKRQIGDNAGQNYERMLGDELTLAEKHANRFANPGKELSKKKSRILAHRGIERARRDRITEAAGDLYRSIRCDPTNPRPFFYFTSFVPGRLRDMWFRAYDSAVKRSASPITWDG